VLREPVRGHWLVFTAPWRILTTRRSDEVLPLIRQVDAAVEQTGLYAVGFISYEAAAAFDPALPAGDPEDFPLVWFCLFRQVQATTTLTGGQSRQRPVAWQPSVTPEEYRRCFDAVKRYIQNGDTYQVNLTYRLRTNDLVDPWDFFVETFAPEPAPYAAFVDTGEWAICSASPELFLRREGAQVESRPMKGTAARGLWFEDDCARAATLHASAKERAENVMIVDMVRNDLGRVALTGSVQVPALFAVERYPTVWQMTSTVRARTQVGFDQLLQSSFPPASITGAPKRRAMEIIAELESTPRHIYTGTIGFMAPGQRAQFNVAIRTVLCRTSDRSAEYGVGGGIVWDSHPAHEQQECRTKQQVLQPRRYDFDLLETLRWSPHAGYWLREYHLKRLAQSAAYFGFTVDLPRIRAELDSIAAGLPLAHHRVRLVVARSGACHCRATMLEAGALRFGDLTLARTAVDANEQLLYHKTTNRRIYADALALSPDSADVLLFNTAGEITESTIANVAFTINGTFCTPPVQSGLLPGTYRAWLLDQGKICERVVTIEQAYQATTVYLLNSVRGLHQVRLA
jgi:para-aminobenzoate synthetase/4-amino-4-deoxychorismate lyase